jgi:hypothetical protein
MGIVLPLSLFAFLFCEKASLWPGSKGVKRKKHRPRYFGLRISDFGFFGFSFSIRIPHLNCPPDPKNETCLMVFAFNALASGPGKT